MFVSSGARAFDRLGAVVELPLRVSRIRRAGSTVLGLTAVLVGLGSVIGVLRLLADRDSLVLHPLPTTSIAFLIGYVLIRFGWMRARPSFARRPVLRIEGGFLVVDHRGLLRRPLRVPWAQVTAIAIDDGLQEPARSSRRQRFHLPSDAVTAYPQRALPRWLFSPGQGSPFPLLSHVTDTPNVAILLREPVSLTHVRNTRPLPAASAAHFPVPRSRARGLLLRIKDPHRLTDAVGTRAAVRQLTLDDIIAVEPPTSEQRDSARKIYAARTAMAILVALGALGPGVAASGVIHRGERSPAGGGRRTEASIRSCPGAPGGPGHPSSLPEQELPRRCADSTSNGRGPARRT